MKKFYSSRCLILMLVCIMSVCIFVSRVNAETIALKSGRTIEAEILERRDSYIRVIENDAFWTFWYNDIADIDGIIPPDPPTAASKSTVRVDPDDYGFHLYLAARFIQKGDGISAMEHGHKALQLNREKAIEHGVYNTLILGYYSAGEFKGSYEYVEKALKVDPDDKFAKSFKEMLDKSSKEKYEGKIPEKINFSGYDSTKALREAVEKEGIAFRGSKDKPDTIIFDFGELTLIHPPGWHKQKNIQTTPTDKTLLFYTKYPDRDIPSIAVTKDRPDSSVHKAIDFTRMVKKMFTAQAPTMTIIGPQEITLNGMDVSYIEMQEKRVGARLAWYQFLIDRMIVTIQLTTTEKDFSIDSQILKRIAQSLKVDTRHGVGGLSVTMENALHYMSKKQYDSAISEMSTVIKRDPSFAPAYYNRGNAYMLKGDSANAIADYTKVVKYNPKDALAYANRAVAHQHKGDFEASIVDYKKSLDINPKLDKSLLGLGYAFSELGEFEKAKEYYRRAIAMGPKDAENYRYRGEFYKKHGYFSEAISDFTKAIQLKPSRNLYTDRGEAYRRNNNSKRALADFTKAIEVNPKVAAPYYNRAVFYFDLKEYDKAWKDVHKATSLGLDVHPNFLKVLKEASGREK